MVAKPDPETLESMFYVMGQLEAMCASLAAKRMEAAERAALDALHAEMAEVVHKGDKKVYTHLNETFHGAIYDGADNPYLAEITRATRLRLRPFRQAQFAARGRLAGSHAEHDEILKAILRGESDRAADAMSRHISQVEGAFHTLLPAKPSRHTDAVPGALPDAHPAHRSTA